MRKLILLLTVSAFVVLPISPVVTQSAQAAVPSLISIQGKLTDANGDPITTVQQFNFRVFDAAVGGAQIWPSGGGNETQVKTPDSGGLWSANLGANVPLTDAFFGDTVRWLEIMVGATTLPRTRLVTGPYAHRVSTVDGASGGTITSKVSIGPGHTNSGDHAFVAGKDNVASGAYATVGGGERNRAVGEHSVVAGGGAGFFNPGFPDSNLALGSSSVVGGGNRNEARGTESLVAGGSENIASGLYSTVSGGHLNVAAAQGATVSGGESNSAETTHSSVSGGVLNEATGDGSTVGGGGSNRARGAFSVVSGGGNNLGADSNSAIGAYSSIGGGRANTTTGDGAVVIGGDHNLASGDSSCVLGGGHNFAGGRLSIAAGYFAQAANTGSVVIVANGAGITATDSTRSSKADQMVLRADGEFYLTNVSGATPSTSDFINTSTGAVLTAGGTWTNSSDRNAKENFIPVDREALLETIMKLPITRWNYIAEDDTVSHIGPVAQDFRTLFGVGANDKTISTIDPSGIALAAIQELYRKTQEIDELKSELAELRRLVQESRK